MIALSQPGYCNLKVSMYLVDMNFVLKPSFSKYFSCRFGYGLMDAYAMVELARNWTSVPLQRKCEVNAVHVDK